MDLPLTLVYSGKIITGLERRDGSRHESLKRCFEGWVSQDPFLQ
jgi:hypothetical protein